MPNYVLLDFVDDCLIFFFQSNNTTALEIKYILKHYSKLLGHLINYHKSEVQFSARLYKQVHKQIMNVLHIASTSTIDTYLEYSKTDKRRARSDFDGIKHKIEQNLTDATRTLRNVSKVVLTKSNLSGIHNIL